MSWIRSLFFRKDPVYGPGRYASLKIGLIADELTAAGLSTECAVQNLTPSNYRRVLKNWRPDFVLVESAWRGYRDYWKYKIASYPDHPRRNNAQLKALLDMARELGIKAVFWNKEDGVHYERFIDTAKLFDFVLTVDEQCIDKYKRDLAAHGRVATLMFPIQPRFHYLADAPSRIDGFACFVGSYSRHIHPKRQYWQDMMFDVVGPYGLDVFDRNYKRKADNYRYPNLPGMSIRRGVPYQQTAELYRRYQINLNVNTVETSPTMFSRRLIEILAVGGVAVSTPSIAVMRLFSEFCYVVNSKDELIHTINQIKSTGIDKARERARAGAAHIAEFHTWEARLQDLENLGIF